MSTVAEVKTATERLSAQERWELCRWLAESQDVLRLRHEELRREIAIGMEQIERGEFAPLDTEKTKAEVRRRLRNEGK